ncbi:hypothetical protein DFH09DRAFT_1330434 [Mycena vulgaris]|nr:hypothetical protein DFH09DRAFT_1330434 [Mycena vulgaris]
MCENKLLFEQFMMQPAVDAVQMSLQYISFVDRLGTNAFPINPLISSLEISIKTAPLKSSLTWPPTTQPTTQTHRLATTTTPTPLARRKLKQPLGNPIAEPRYVYYRIYMVDGAIPSKTDSQSGNPFVGRIQATSVPPPHTVASLKRALVQAEELPDPNGDLTGFFQTTGARTAMIPGARVTILTGDIGATPETGFALVFHAEVPIAGVHASPLEELVSGESSTYLYYRLYTRGGEDASGRAFDSRHPELGRIQTELISPPRDVSSIKRRIAKVEKKSIYLFAELFPDMSADRALASDAFLPDTCGATENTPILLVQPERRAGLHNRPIRVLSVPPESGKAWSWGPSRWLSPSPGDVLHTDGISRLETDSKGWHIYAYTAVDRRGKTGLLRAAHTEFLDENPSSWQCTIQ